MLLKLPFTAQKWSFPLRISTVNVTKSVRNPSWKTSFFIQCLKFRHVAWILSSMSNFRSNSRRCFIKINILENLAKFKGNTCTGVSILIKLQARNLWKFEISIPVFPCFLVLKFVFDEVTAACATFLIYVLRPCKSNIAITPLRHPDFFFLSLTLKCCSNDIFSSSTRRDLE